MNSLSELRHDDLRAVFLLLGECCELGERPHAWCLRLHERLTAMLHTRLTVVMELEAPAAQGAEGPGPEDRVMLFGDLSKEARTSILHFMATGAIRNDPFVEPWNALKLQIGSRARHQLLSDRDWYGSSVFNEYYSIAHVDHRLFSQCPGSYGQIFCTELWRALGDPPYSRREIQIMELTTRELARFIQAGRLTTPCEPQVDALTPRLQEVLLLVGRGLGEKQVADKLNLSRHTVHDYVKQLHQILDVGTRGELVSHAYDMSKAHILRPPFRGVDS